jgi:hypothetical protein
VLDGAVLDRASFVPPFASDEAGLVCAGSLRVNSQLGSLAPVWSRAPLQALARAHLLAAGEVLPAEEIGRPRTESDRSGRLGAMAELAVAPTAAPALLLASVVHGELLVVQPFSWGNAIVARAAQRLVLISRGVDPDALSVPEEGHLMVGRPAYAEAIEAYRAGTPDGVAGWIVHCASAVAQGAQVGRQIAATVASGAQFA